MFNANGLGAHSGLDLLAVVAARSSTGSATPGDGASPKLVTFLSGPGLYNPAAISGKGQDGQGACY